MKQLKRSGNCVVEQQGTRTREYTNEQPIFLKPVAVLSRS